MEYIQLQNMLKVTRKESKCPCNILSLKLTRFHKVV